MHPHNIFFINFSPKKTDSIPVAVGLFHRIINISVTKAFMFIPLLILCKKKNTVYYKIDLSKAEKY